MKINQSIGLQTVKIAVAVLFCCMAGADAAGRIPSAENTLSELKAGWDHPARTYRSHTRWWWPGNALTKTDITWQLEQMA